MLAHTVGRRGGRTVNGASDARSVPAVQKLPNHAFVPLPSDLVVILGGTATKRDRRPLDGGDSKAGST